MIATLHMSEPGRTGSKVRSSGAKTQIKRERLATMVLQPDSIQFSLISFENETQVDQSQHMK